VKLGASELMRSDMSLPPSMVVCVDGCLAQAPGCLCEPDPEKNTREHICPPILPTAAGAAAPTMARLVAHRSEITR
jgi:hypothetical protein